jgi:hypothetical protein
VIRSFVFAVTHRRFSPRNPSRINTSEKSRFNSPRINTSRNHRNNCEFPSISLILNNFNSTRINTSENKDLKPRRINTSGNKDLKSFRINTSKKPGRGRVPPAFSGISWLATRHCSLAARFFPQLATRHSSLAALHIYFHAHRFTIRATLRGAI